MWFLPRLQDRIVGELLQPGGVMCLERMGLESTISPASADSVDINGYIVVKVPHSLCAARAWVCRFGPVSCVIRPAALAALVVCLCCAARRWRAAFGAHGAALPDA